MAPSSSEEGSAMAAVPDDEHQQPWEYILRKYVLMLATLVVTVTYGVGFNPPGGVWKQTQFPFTFHADRDIIAGEPIVLKTSYIRYMVFFYCNSAAFAFSVVVIVLFLILSLDMVEQKDIWIRVMPLRVLMVLDLLSIMGAYAAGTWCDKFTIVYTLVVMAAAAMLYMSSQMVLAWYPPSPTPGYKYDRCHKNQVEEQLRKVLMLLATFAVSVTYVAGLSSPPGGFSDNPKGKHYPAGEAVLSHGRHKVRLAMFFACNTTAFVASLLIIMLLLGRKVRRGMVKCRQMLVCILVALVSLIGAYAAGSSREAASTTYMVAAVAAGLTCVKLHSCWRHQAPENGSLPSDQEMVTKEQEQQPQGDGNRAGEHSPDTEGEEQQGDRRRNRALSPAEVEHEQSFSHGHRAGEGCRDNKGEEQKVDGHRNLAPSATQVDQEQGDAHGHHHTGELSHVEKEHAQGDGSVHLAGEISPAKERDEQGDGNGHRESEHIPFTEQEEEEEHQAGGTRHQARQHSPITEGEEQGQQEELEQQGSTTTKCHSSSSLLLMLATFATAMTYQAGMHPPGGFWEDYGNGHLAGKPILLTTNSIRYKAFWCCNSTAFVSSLVTVLLLGKLRHMVEAAMIVESLFLMGAYAVGACRDACTSIYVIALAGAVLFYVLIHVIFFTLEQVVDPRAELRDVEKKRKLLYLLATLSTAMSYQSGLSPPGGFWSHDSAYNDKYNKAGDPIRSTFFIYEGSYEMFFYCNSLSFMLSVTTMILLVSPVHYRPAIRSGALTVCTVAGMACLMLAYMAGTYNNVEASVGMFVLVCVSLLILVTLPLVCFVRDRMMKRKTLMMTEEDVDQEGQDQQQRQQGEQIHDVAWNPRRWCLLPGRTRSAGRSLAGQQWRAGRRQPCHEEAAISCLLL